MAVLAAASTAMAAQEQLDHLPLPSTTPNSDRFHRVLEITDRVDPMTDNYLVERLAAQAEQQIARLCIEACSGRGPESPGLRMLFTGVPNWPEPAAEDLELIYDATGFVVQRKADGVHRPVPWAGILGSAKTCEAVGSVIAVPSLSPDSFTTVALITLWGVDDTGLFQHNSTWSVRWRLADEQDAPPRIESIGLDSFERITATRPVFEDCTASILRSEPIVADSLARDSGFWFDRIDRLFGQDFLGHTGLAIGDVNGDGLDDVYRCMTGGVPNMLLVQQQDGTVRNLAAEANVDMLDVTRAALLADLDNDGDQDLALSIRNATVIMENIGGGIFNPDPVLSAPTSSPSEFYSIAAADVDQNRYLDLYSMRYVRTAYGASIPVPYFDANNGPSNHLLMHDGNWSFREQTRQLGLDENNRRFSLAASWEDFDDDGDQDLYVTNDFGRANFFVRDGEVFADQADQRGVRNMAAGMGVSWGDVNRDGRMDLYVSNMYSPPGARIMASNEFRAELTAEQRRMFRDHAMGNALFLAQPEGTFRRADRGLRRGVEGWSWGGLFVDFNNDGWLDMLVPNGNLTQHRQQDIDSLFWRQVASVSPLRLEAAPAYVDGWAAMSLLMLDQYTWAGRQRNVTYLNLGDGTFADVSAISGFGLLDDARALATTDWDGDGDLDLWITCRSAPAMRFLRNTVREHHPEASGALQFELVGRTVSRDAIGARAWVDVGGARLIDTLLAGEGYLAQSSKVLHIGIGQAREIGELNIRWPGGQTESFGPLPTPSGRYRVVQGASESPLQPRITDRPVPALSPGPLPDRTAGVGEPARVVLLDPVPLPPMAFDCPEEEVITLDELLGRPVVLVFWSGRNRQSIDDLLALDRTLTDTSTPVRIRLLATCVDGDEHRPAAIARVRELGVQCAMIECSPELLDLVDVLQQEILGRPEDLVIPSAITVDRLGMITALHRGEVSFDAVLTDSGPPEMRPVSGRLLFPQRRSFGSIAQMLRQRGHPELAAFYLQIERRQSSPQR